MSNKIFSNDAEQLWTKLLTILKEKVPKPSFDTWIAPLKVKSLEDDTLVIIAPNDFAKEWVVQRYKKYVIEALIEVSNGREYKLKVSGNEEGRVIKNFRMDGEQALGYLLLACKEVGVPLELVQQLHKSMRTQFDYHTPEEAKHMGTSWLHPLKDSSKHS